MLTNLKDLLTYTCIRLMQCIYIINMQCNCVLVDIVHFLFLLSSPFSLSLSENNLRKS